MEFLSFRGLLLRLQPTHSLANNLGHFPFLRHFCSVLLFVEGGSDNLFSVYTFGLFRFGQRERESFRCLSSPPPPFLLIMFFLIRSLCTCGGHATCSLDAMLYVANELNVWHSPVGLPRCASMAINMAANLNSKERVPHPPSSSLHFPFICGRSASTAFDSRNE